MMMKPMTPGIVILSLLGLLWAPLGYAQTPYWDNSNGGSFYTPQPQQQQQNYTQQQYNSQQYGQTNQYGQYGQQQQQQYYGQQQYNNTQQYGNSQTQLQGYVSTAPAGTNLNVTTTTYLSSATSQIGDPVSVTLGYDLSMGGSMLLPAGTQIQGQVVSAMSGGRTGRPGQLQLRFNRAMLPDGRQYPLSARVITQDGSGIIKGGTTGRRVGNVAKNTLGGAALGAAAGTALGAIVGGGNKWNEGMLWGSVLGAGAGAGRSVLQRGDEAEVQPGTQLQLMLDQPLSINAGAAQNNNYGYPY